MPILSALCHPAGAHDFSDYNLSYITQIDDANLANYQSDTQHQKAMETSAYLQYCQPLSEKLLMELGARASGYHCQKSYYRMIPHLGVHYNHVRYGPFNFLMPIMPFGAVSRICWHYPESP